MESGRSGQRRITLVNRMTWVFDAVEGFVLGTGSIESVSF